MVLALRKLIGMKYLRQIEGVVPVVQTPLLKNAKFDAQGQANLIEFLNSKPVGGFWCLGTGSEDMNLSFERRLRVARVVCRANNGVTPLVLGCGFFCLDETFDFIEATQDLDFDAYHYMPYHPLLSMDRIAWIYKRIADFSRKPLFMYTSANWAQPINSKFVSEMLGYKNICGIKFSSSNTVEQLKVLNMQTPDFQVITAVANQFFAALAMGSKAGTTSMAGALPEPLIEMYEAFRDGGIDDARNMQVNFQKFSSMLPIGSKRDNFLTAAEEKFILNLRGVCEPYTTSYYRDLDDAEQKEVIRALEFAGYDKYLLEANR
jgi:4-hydroxy-tetrahydrodipicolinate synthase